jgi:hypothetical protein
MPTTTQRPRATLLLAAALLMSCGSVTSADQACSDVAQARCGKRMTCTNGAGITRTWGDMTTCLAREKLTCSIGLAAPSTGNSPSQVEKCVVAMAGESCSDFLDNNPPADCAPVGPRATGGACAFTGQCASAFCNNDKTSVCGTCGAMPAAGTSCATANCGHNQECVTTTEICQEFGAMGAACDADVPCAADLSCVGATATAMGACMAASATAGMPCGGTTPGCDGTMGLSCGGAAGAKTCMSVNYVGDGMACGTLTGGTFQACAGGGTCYTATGVALSSQMGACKAPAPDNGACDTTLGPGCLAPARCITTAGGSAGTCTVPSGATCG